MNKINRKVDELGRIVLPAEFREELGIKQNSSLSIFIDTNRIILQKGIEVDALGRIVIPKEIRKMLEIKEKQDLEIEVEEDKIILNIVK